MRHVSGASCYPNGTQAPPLQLVCEAHIQIEDIERTIAQLKCALKTRPALPPPVPLQYDVLCMPAKEAQTSAGQQTFIAAWGAGQPIHVTGVTMSLSPNLMQDFLADNLLHGLHPEGLFVRSSFKPPAANGTDGAGLTPDYEQEPVPDMTVPKFLAEYNSVKRSKKSKIAAKVKDLPPHTTFQEWRPCLFAVFIALLGGIAPTYVGAAALNLLSYFPALNKMVDGGPKAYIAWRGDFDANGYPANGQTNLHADMSHAVNLAVSARKGCPAQAVVATWNLWHCDDQAAVTPLRSLVHCRPGAGVFRPPSADAHVCAHAGAQSGGGGVPLPACGRQTGAC
jgi:hypothetical protein